MKHLLSILRKAAVITAFLVSAVLFVSGLNYLKFEKVLRQTQQATIQITGKSLVETVEFALDLGMRVEDLGSLQRKMTELIASEASIRKVTLADFSGRLVLDTSQQVEDDQDRALRKKIVADAKSDFEKISFSVSNNFGEVAATLVVWHDDAAVERVLKELMSAFLIACAYSFAIALPLMMAFIPWARREDLDALDNSSTKRLQYRALFVSGLAITGVVLYVSFAIFNVFEREVRPLMQGESGAIARSIMGPLSRTADNNFAFSSVPDVEQFFDDALKLYPNAVAIGLRQADGWSIQRTRDRKIALSLAPDAGVDKSSTSLTEAGFEAIAPLKNADGIVAWLHVVTSPNAVISAITDARWDIAVLILVSLFTIFEIFRFVFGRVMARQTDDENPVSVAPVIARLPLFLFVFGEQLAVSFNVIHGRELAGVGASGLVYALPIVAFVGAIALSGSYAARLVKQIGARKALLVGCLIMAAGFVAAFWTSLIWLFVVARFVNGVGYAIATVALQSVMSRGDNEQAVKSNLASFTSVIMIGCICGAAVGGVLAERVGFNFVFLVSGVLVLTPILFIGLITDDEPHIGRRQEPFGLGHAMRISNFVVVLCLVAIPAKFVLHGYVYYLAPLYLKDMGLSQGAVARNVMLYALFMVPAITLGNWLTRKNISSDSLMLGASIFTAVALVLAGVETAIAIAMIGVIQGVASVPMLGKIPKIAAGDRSVQVALFAILRSGERVGSMLGPMIAGVTLAFLDASHATLPLVALCVLLSCGLVANHVFVSRKQVS